MSDESVGFRVYRAPRGASFAGSVGPAFNAFRAINAAAAVLVFPQDVAPDRAAVEAVVVELQRTPALGQLFLVHPSPQLGFMTSTICLRVPTAKVRACASLDDAEALAVSDAW